MSKDLEPYKERDVQQSAELETFRKNFNITDVERFNNAVTFCEKIIDGGVVSQVYSAVFNVPIEKARTVAANFHRSKWVQELILFLRPDEQSLYFGERKKIIRRGMQIIDDPNASNRDVTEAIKALQPYLKQEKIDHEVSLKGDSSGQSLQMSINDKLTEISERGMMVDKSGNIIDVDVIE